MNHVTVDNNKIDFKINPDIDEITKLIPEIDLLKAALLNSAEMFWVWSIKEGKFLYAYVDEKVVGLIPDDFKADILADRIIDQDRPRMIHELVKGVGIAEKNRSHYKIPVLYTQHKDGRGIYMPTVVSMLVYYDSKAEKALYVIGDTRVSYLNNYREVLMSQLSPREQECLKYIIAGKSQKEIIRLTGSSDSALSTYKQRIREKTGLEIQQIVNLF